MNDISSLRDPPVTQVDRLFQGWRPEGCDRVALVLQGGGALGAYQAGVYQALHEAGSNLIGFRVFRSAQSMPQSSPAMCPTND